MKHELAEQRWETTEGHGSPHEVLPRVLELASGKYKK